MLRQITVTNPQTGRPMNVEMLSTDGGKTSFMKPASLIEFRRRAVKIAYLNDNEKRWLDMIELPSGTDIRSAVRMGSYGGAQ